LDKFKNSKKNFKKKLKKRIFPFQNTSHKMAKIGYQKQNKTKLIKPTAMGNQS
jgi:hypothetical protein